MEEKNSDAEDSKMNMETTITEKAKCKKILTQNIQEIHGHNVKTKPRDNEYRRE